MGNPIQDPRLWPEAVMQRELGPDERLLWAGKPRGEVRLQASDAFMIPFSLFWCGFACFWEYMVIRQNGPLLMRLWGVPFVAIGLYLVVGRFFADARRRGNTWYGLTDQRVIILSGVFRRTARSLNLRTLPEINLTTESDGSGTIAFGPSLPRAYAAAGWGVPANAQSARFEMIENARDVYDRIRAAQKAAQSA